MFTWSVRVRCSLPACRAESVKYQTCLIFLRPLPTIVSDTKFIHLAAGLSVNLTACRLHFPVYRLCRCSTGTDPTTLGSATKVGGSGTKIHKKGCENMGSVAPPQQAGTLTDRTW